MKIPGENVDQEENVTIGKGILILTVNSSSVNEDY